MDSFDSSGFLGDLLDRHSEDSIACIEWYSNLLPYAMLENKFVPSKELKPYLQEEIISSLSTALELADRQDEELNLNYQSAGLLLNNIGTYYSLAQKNIREEILWQSVLFLDKHFGKVSNGTTEITAVRYVRKINEPDFVRDLCMNRFFYSANLEELKSTNLLKECRSWRQYKEKIKEQDNQENSMSMFEARIPIIYQKYCTERIQTGFYQDEPRLASRVIKAASGIVYATALTNHVKHAVPMRDGILIALEEYDPKIYVPMLDHIEEKDWILWPHKSQSRR